jgi:hypothetical protein
MRPISENDWSFKKPLFSKKAEYLGALLKTKTRAEIKQIMKLSDDLTDKTVAIIAGWNSSPKYQRQAIDSFLGDTYSGLQLANWTKDDLHYADSHLLIVSGLYGLLRPTDGICPYRVEMSYKVPGIESGSLYKYWGKDLVNKISDEDYIVNLTAKEYGRLITDYTDAGRLIEPRFLSINPKTSKPTFVVVHAKIARGAFASWMIQNKVESVGDLTKFNQLGYLYDDSLSTANSPAFICKNFRGLGLSVRLNQQVL